MSLPCRVLILNERDPLHPKAGGAEVHVWETFGRLAAQGYETTVVTCRFGGSAPREDVGGLHVWRVGPLATYYPRAAWACARETRRGRFDVVVDCLNKAPFYSPAYSAAPVLALCHHLFGEVAFLQVPWPIAATVWTAERLIPYVYRRRPFVTISESSREDLIRRGLPGDRIRVIYCGIEKPRVAARPWAERPRRVTFVGRLEPYKRADVMLRAMARLSDAFPDAEIVVVGQGSARPSLEALAKDLGLESRTRFTGFVSAEERDALLADSRVSVFPSPKEGWGLTAIESNAVGTPVVASNAPGLRESVRDGATGFLVREGDEEAFARRIAQILSDDELGARLSAQGLAWSRNFDWDRAASEMAEALEAVRLESGGETSR